MNLHGCQGVCLLCNSLKSPGTNVTTLESIHVPLAQWHKGVHVLINTSIVNTSTHSQGGINGNFY